MTIKNWFAQAALSATLALALAACNPVSQSSQNRPQQADFQKIDNGIIVNLPQSPSAKALRVEVIADNILRISASPSSSFNLPDSLMVVAEPDSETPYEVQALADMLRIKTGKIRADIALPSGKIRFFNADGEPILVEENRGQFAPVTADPMKPDTDAFAIRQSFKRASDEALYGLGQHQHGHINLAGQDVEMTTHNLVITVPYLVSTRNYGILWDNNSQTRFGDPEPAKALHTDLTLFDAEGRPGGLTARYYDGDELKFSRVESDLDYQFLSHSSVRENPMPDAVKDAKNLRVEWEGSIQAKTTGTHRFKMYSSSYAKLFINNELKLDRWRMNWNPWFHNFEMPMQVGEKYKIKIDWLVNGGYFRLLHRDPLPEAERELISFASETGKAIDYYVVTGNDMDQVISGYRHLTGKSVMLPRWAYGFWQSRERYKSQDEIIDALKEYRQRKIPIDNIVLDWSYWPVDAWGSHDFDPEFFPDPKALVDKVHQMNAQIMISVWPKFYPTTKHYKALNEKGYMLNGNIEEGNLDWIGKGYLNAFYDAFNPDGREMFWRQLDNKINVYGFDAWWLDAVEPDMHSNTSWQKRMELMSPNHLGSGAELFNAYALPHAETVYRGDRAADNKRVFILTRSGFGGIQRTASAVWSGDIVSRWSNLKEQIAAGVGTAMAGVPNWTFDIGGFTPEDRFRSNATKSPFVGPFSDMDKDQVDEWQELNTRWYQFGAFVPLYRSHGQNPYREIYNIAEQDSEHYQSMVWYSKLRYRLLPYIYSIAGDMHHKDATLMRALAMDFPHDKRARNLNDAYLFGPAFLVNPIYQYGARTRDLYLPSGATWYDFYTGKRFHGGQQITVAAPLERMPLFVKAGSIVPTGPEIQHSDELLNADITINVFTGADGAFELYEDDGRSYGYEKGEWSRIPLQYNEMNKTLTIGERIGKFPGMASKRALHIRWISGESPTASDFSAGIRESVNYNGSPLSIILNKSVGS
ncbi:MAG: DUF5110 domain-containing protein [Cellvibrionaceae bacterium]|nr:DUF5110 domain-containing protein [Cellvibrionaceae bacterium]